MRIMRMINSQLTLFGFGLVCWLAGSSPFLKLRWWNQTRRTASSIMPSLPPMMIVFADNLKFQLNLKSIHLKASLELFSPAKCRQREKRCQLVHMESVHRPMGHNRIEHERKSVGGKTRWILKIYSIELNFYSWQSWTSVPDVSEKHSI